MSLRSVVATIVGRSGGGVHRECRQCGTTLGNDTDDCHECGSDDVVVYDVW